MWYQGLDRAPDLVRLCVRSWGAFNPDWKVRVLDRTSLGEFLDLPSLVDEGRDDLTVQKLSNIVRVGLLRRHGGVWADGTVFCARPLDDWLPSCYAAGFFAFRDPGRDRLLSTWFMAAEPDNAIVRMLLEEFAAFWRDNRFSNQNTPVGRMMVRLVSRYANRNPRRTRVWLSPVVRKAMKVYPYFVFHYVANRLLLDDEACRAVWAAVVPRAAGPSHFVQRSRNPCEARAWLVSETVPMHKLTWRADVEDPYWRAVVGELEAVLRRREGGAGEIPGAGARERVG
jgi:hypothetical protein